MNEKLRKHYLFASDFDQTLSFNDSGFVLSELLGIPVEDFRRKATGMAELNLVQQGAELAYLLLHDPQFRSRVRRDHLLEVRTVVVDVEHAVVAEDVLALGVHAGCRPADELGPDVDDGHVSLAAGPARAVR